MSLLTKFLGFVMLPLALLGVYLHQATDTGRLRLMGYVTATFGTVLTAGDWCGSSRSR